MAPSSSKRTFRIVVIVLSLVIVGILCFTGIILYANRPLSDRAIAATMTAMPTPTPTSTPTPTPVPTLPGSSAELLACQRQASLALDARDIVGAVNLSDDYLFLLKWVSLDWAIESVDDAVAGLIMGFDVALDVWEHDCAVYDRVQIEVYDRRGEEQVHQFTVKVTMDDLLQWRGGKLADSDLIARLEVIDAVRAP